MDDICAICAAVGKSEHDLQKLYSRMLSDDDKVASNAAWILTHAQQTQWLQTHQHEMIDIAMSTPSTPLRRLTLALLNEQTFEAENIRSDFVDYCMERINTLSETLGVRSLCIKLAYKQCCLYPELLQELQTILELTCSMCDEPSVRCTSLKTLKMINKASKKL